MSKKRIKKPLRMKWTLKGSHTSISSKMATFHEMPHSSNAWS